MAADPLIDASALRDRLDDPTVRIVDCRFSLSEPAAGRVDYERAHIPGAVYADLDQDLSAPIDAASGRHPLPQFGRLCARLGSWGVDETRQVVVYDAADGAIAARLWWLLRYLGHEAVALLDGGWQAWTGQDGPTESGFREFEQRIFTQRASAMTWVSTAALSDQLARDSVALVDARSAERFRGDVEPIDPVAGHVPGAINHPYTDNIVPSGRMRSVDSLRAMWTRRLAGRAPREVVHMCGSGVTACQNLLAMELAGLSGSRLYPGSWSEWIRDPARPVATGGQ